MPKKPPPLDLDGPVLVGPLNLPSLEEKAEDTAPKPKPKPTPVKTTAPSVQKGVHPGAFCSPRGALGRTSKGTLMRCGPSATDSRNRWRAA